LSWHRRRVAAFLRLANLISRARQEPGAITMCAACRH
jgi:hypothetical protein